MNRFSFRPYVREVFELFPPAAIGAYRERGFLGLRIALSAYLLRFAPWPQETPIGRLTLHAELLNFLDNFCANELRCQEVESYLRSQSAPTVVDIGINVGVTARWWLALSSRVRVVGIDMLPEALDFTSLRIEELGFRNRWTPICSAVGNKPGTTRLFLGDPLDGTTSLNAAFGPQEREVSVRTLDDLLKGLDLNTIDLVKIDIEGHGGLALEGAIEVLKRVRYVCLESHGNDETERSACVLVASGFILFSLTGRHTWWRKRS